MPAAGCREGTSKRRPDTQPRAGAGARGRRSSGAVQALFSLLLVGVVLVGCGGSSASSTATISAAQLQAAKKAGEEKAEERDRVNSLQKQLRSLRHQVRHGGSLARSSSAPSSNSQSAPAVESEPSVRAFHSPSGNVSCEILADGATCTVESIAETFSFAGGEPAQIEPGVQLSSDLGELAAYGSTVSAGSISCEIPPSSVARGVSCSDSTSGHGFEASRVAARQSAY